MPVITRLPPSYKKIDIKPERDRERTTRIGESTEKEHNSFLIRRLSILGKNERRMPYQ